MITNFIVGLHIASRNHTYGSGRWEYNARFYYYYNIFGRLVTPSTVTIFKDLILTK